MDSATWTCISPGESWELVCEQGKAHVMKSESKVIWLVDGGPVDEVESVEAAMDAAERALGLNPRRGVDGQLLPGSTAPEAGEVLAPKPHLCDVIAGTRPVLPALRVGPGFEVKTIPLLARITERQPADVRAELLGRVERVERYTEAIRALAEEGGDASLIATMLGEADADAQAAVEASLEVLREQQKALAFAETRVALAKEELERSRREVAEIETAIERIKDKAIRPLCETAGQGDTRAIKAETGRVSLRRTPGRVELDEDPDLLDFIAATDPGLVRIKREPDRAAIAAALKAGREVPGARLVVETRVEVRG